MPRLRIAAAFIGGVVVWVLAGLVPAEVINWLREWSGRAGPDPDVAPVANARRRARRKRRLS